MQKLILNSILIYCVVLPAVAAAERNPRRALQKAVAWTLAGVCAYVFAVLFIYPHFLG